MELAPGSVELRLRGREPEFVVSLPPADQPADDAAEVEGVARETRRATADDANHRSRGSTSVCRIA